MPQTTDWADVQVVGIPRAPLFYRFGVLWTTFFESIGRTVVVSDPTDKAIADEGDRLSVDECCLASKIYLGHVASLVDSMLEDYISAEISLSAQSNRRMTRVVILSAVLEVLILLGALLLSAGEVVGVAVQQGRQAAEGHRLLQPLFPQGGLQLLAVKCLVQVLADGLFHEQGLRVLRQDADTAGALHRAAVGRQRSAEQVERGALAGAVATDEGDDFAFLDIHIDALEHHVGAEGLGDPPDRHQDAGSFVHSFTHSRDLHTELQMFLPCRFCSIAMILCFSSFVNVSTKKNFAAIRRGRRVCPFSPQLESAI